MPHMTISSPFMEKFDSIRREFAPTKDSRKERKEVMMRSRFTLLVGIAVLFLVSSCATTEPLREGELRLLKINVPENGNLRIGHDYKFGFTFESDGSAEIVRVVCTCASEVPRVYKPQDVRYGSKTGNFSLWLFACTGESQRLTCHADYVSGGKRQRSNSVSALIFGIY